MLPRLHTAVCLLLLTLSAANAVGRHGYKSGQQDWGFIDVRAGAHMFYWLYYTQARVAHYTARPLVLWLDGGPGLSSTGSGNFLNIGPLHLNGSKRKNNWVQHVNVLFVDSPVGAGFSYCDDESCHARNNTQIAKDLLSFMQQFLQLHTEFQTVPLHIFSYSYGGKMAPEFALALYQATQRNKLHCQLATVTLGNPWVSPVETINTLAPLLLQTGIIDHAGYANLTGEIARIDELIATAQWSTAFKEYATLVYDLYTQDICLYNILNAVNQSEELNVEKSIEMQRFMRGPVKQALQLTIGVEWAAQSDNVMYSLIDDFMQSAVHIYQKLLNETPIRVAIYTGQLDLMCSTAGTVNWIGRMSWLQKRKYLIAKRRPIIIKGILEGYHKGAANFQLFWINRAGHYVAQDNVKAMNYVLKKVTRNYAIEAH